jgi:hypothetical protein
MYLESRHSPKSCFAQSVRRVSCIDPTWVNLTFCVFRLLGYLGDEIAKAKECERITFYNVSDTQENAS